MKLEVYNLVKKRIMGSSELKKVGLKKEQRNTIARAVNKAFKSVVMEQLQETDEFDVSPLNLILHLS